MWAASCSCEVRAEVDICELYGAAESPLCAVDDPKMCFLALSHPFMASLEKEWYH